MTRLSRLAVILLLLPFSGFAEGLEISGLMKSLTAVDSYGASSILGMAGDESAMVEERVAGRIAVTSEIVEKITLHVHYENSFSKGEYLSAVEALEGRTGYMNKLKKKSPDDSEQVFYLTQEYVDENGEAAYHRLDRMYLEYTGSDINIRLGRQALTWGSGKVFNPVDMMNPYAPTDTIRDYKNGSDMFVLQAYTGYFEDVQAAVVPRRNPDTQEFEYNRSSAAMKLKDYLGETDFEMVFGTHYGDKFAGGGFSSFLGEALFRADFIAANGEFRNYVNAVANIDYSWLFLEKNTYGFIEFYYNSLGAESVNKLTKDRQLMEKLERSDIYLRDRYYTAAGLRYELHPLINLHFSMIYNLRDASFIAQPRMEWDIRENMRIISGLDLPGGNLGSEFGGFYDYNGGGVIAPAKRVYAQVTLYF